MTRDRKINVAMIASGFTLGVIASVARTKARLEGRASDHANLFFAAELGGIALMTTGFYRIKPTAGLWCGGAYVGIKIYERFAKPSLDPATSDAMIAALSKEKDPAILHEFATKLRDAGHTSAADVVEKRAVEITPAARVGQDTSIISEAQARLRDLGYTSVPQDGRLGPETVLALKRFQSLYDLDIDGQISAETLAALRRATTH